MRETQSIPCCFPRSPPLLEKGGHFHFRPGFAVAGPAFIEHLLTVLSISTRLSIWNWTYRKDNGHCGFGGAQGYIRAAKGSCPNCSDGPEGKVSNERWAQTRNVRVF